MKHALRLYIFFCFGCLSACYNQELCEGSAEVQDWNFICERLSTCDANRCESYVCIPHEGEGAVTVNFSNIFGQHSYLTNYNLWTADCENHSNEIPKIKGFSKSFGGISIEGRFDLSRVKIGKAVECFYLDTNGPHCEDFDYLKFMPDLTRAYGLKVLDVSLSSILDVECDGLQKERHRKIPIWNLAQYSNLGDLEIAHLHVWGLVSGVSEFVHCHRGCDVEISVEFDRSQYEEMTEGVASLTPKGRKLLARYDDDNFEELLNLNLSEIEKVDVIIELSKMRHFDLSRLMEGGIEKVDIVSKNCVIDRIEGVEYCRSLKHLHVYMTFGTNGR